MPDPLRAESTHEQEWRAVGRYPDGQKDARSPWLPRERADAIAALLRSSGAQQVRLEPRFKPERWEQS